MSGGVTPGRECALGRSGWAFGPMSWSGEGRRTVEVCGITGEIAFQGRRAERAPVARMSVSMGDRGPDGDGVWDRGWVALAHRRLSIIDLSEGGRQPMTDAQLGLTIVFNGCIYNHHELRRELSDRYTFSSSSDTEVLLKAYDSWGENFVDHLVGMFALVIVDSKRDR